MIDDDVEYEEDGFDIPRLAYIARLIDLVKQKGARVIGLNLILSGTNLDNPGALELQTSVRFAGNVVLSGRAIAAVNRRR